MKFSGDAVKKLMLSHGEKLAIAVVGLLSLLLLWQTVWVPYDRQPDALSIKVDEESRRIAALTWPQEKQQQFEQLQADNTMNRINDALVGLNAANYVWTLTPAIPPTGEVEPLREPVFLPVRSVIADAGVVVVAQRKDVEDEEEEPKTPDGSTSETSESAIPVPGEFDMRNPGAATAGIEGMEGMMMDPTMLDPSMMLDPSLLMMDEFGMMVMGDEAQLQNALDAQNLEAVPLHYVCVRGVFPRREQLAEIAKATNLPSVEYADAQGMLQFWDLIIERKAAVNTDDPWNVPWERVSVQAAVDVLERTPDFDPEFVSALITDPIVTMPLPARLMGRWNTKADHPEVKNYELNPKDMEIEIALNKKALEAYRTDLEIRQQGRTERGGFGQVVRNTGAAQAAYLDQANLTDKKLLDELKKELDASGGDLDAAIAKRIKERVSAAGNLVLVRYIDFTVEPGRAYQYRLKLALRNPNFEQPVELAAHESVVQGETRETPYSEPSRIAFVTPTVAQSVARVDVQAAFRGPTASMNLIYLNEETGTPIKTSVTVEPGQFVSGRVTTHVVRTDVTTYEQESVDIKSDELLVSISSFDKVDRDFHDRLELPPETFGDLGIPAEVLMLDKYGQLRVADSSGTSPAYATAEADWKAMDEAWSTLKDRQKKAENMTLDPTMEDPMMMEMMMGLDRFTSKDRKVNPSQVRRAFGSGS